MQNAFDLFNMNTQQISYYQCEKRATSQKVYFLALCNTLNPRNNGLHFADDVFKCISLNENAYMSIKNSLEFVPRGPINNIRALFF